MKHKKAAALFLGTAITFSICTAGCAGKETGEESLGSSAEQGGMEQGAETELQEREVQTESVRREDENQFSSLNEFQALALDGSMITQEDFSDKDITVINFWALSCGPCLAEMPDLAALEKALPDNIQLMTVCLDGSGNEEYVEYVLDQTGFEGTTLLAGDGDLLVLCQELQYTPTTVFVDSEGNTVGEAVIGGKENLVEFYTGCINSVLADMGKEEISVDTESNTK